MNYAAPGLVSAARGPDPAAQAEAALAIAQQLGALAEGLRAVAGAFPTGAFSWRGPAGELMAELLAARPERFTAAATACAGASSAFSAHADRLGPAGWLRAQAAQAPASLAIELQHRAGALSDDSAQVAAAELTRLAGSAPPRAGRVDRWFHRLTGWRSEVLVGAAQSSEQMVGLAVKAAGRLELPLRPGDRDPLPMIKAAVAGAWQHPGEVLKSAVDWDTWRTNPARAVGHLLPDVVTAGAGGGLATSGRVAEIGLRSRLAVEAAAGRDVARREATAGLARESRQALVGAAVQAADRPGATAWAGEGGTRLSARQNASTEAFHALSAAREPGLTQTMNQISKAADSQLAGLQHRLKAVDSLKRKLATQQARTGEPLPELLAKANDLVRYTVVIDQAAYVRGVPQVAGQLQKQGFHLVGPPNNAWRSSRYRGINTTWQDPATGAAFEVQFHTPASWRVTKATHPMYEEARLPDTSARRRARLEAQIAEAYQAAPIPDGVESISAPTLTPPTRPAPILLPTDYTVHATLATALAGAPVTACPPDGTLDHHERKGRLLAEGARRNTRRHRRTCMDPVGCACAIT